MRSAAFLLVGLAAGFWVGRCVERHTDDRLVGRAAKIEEKTIEAHQACDDIADEMRKAVVEYCGG